MERGGPERRMHSTEAAAAMAARSMARRWLAGCRSCGGVEYWCAEAAAASSRGARRLGRRGSGGGVERRSAEVALPRPRPSSLSPRQALAQAFPSCVPSAPSPAGHARGTPPHHRAGSCGGEMLCPEGESGGGRSSSDAVASSMPRWASSRLPPSPVFLYAHRMLLW